MLHLAPLAMETFKSISYRSHTIFEEYIFPPFSVIIRDSCIAVLPYICHNKIYKIRSFDFT
jgi:hypothetical protein